MKKRRSPAKNSELQRAVNLEAAVGEILLMLEKFKFKLLSGGFDTA